ncbi:MAG: hypothetical protein HFI63_11325 [Lachnospiraceae bacterium]|nr:hypothetical protein [Lachnospiraceae bacterium]
MKKIKYFFETPVKAALSVFCLGFLLALLGAGIFLTASFFAKRSAIGTEHAKALAFANANIDASEARAVHTEFEFEDGRFVYKVEFLTEDMEYEYLIKASNGNILERDVDSLDKTVSSHTTAQFPPVSSSTTIPTESPVSDGTVQAPQASSVAAQPESSVSAPDALTASESSAMASTEAPSSAAPQTEQTLPPTVVSGQISLETAQQTALSDAGLSASKVTYKKAELDYDGRTPVYEIEFYTGTHEYDYEIDAISGEIRQKEQEAHSAALPERHPSNEHTPSAGGSDIGLEAAKSIATKHADVSASDVVFTKAEQDYEDGRLVYEIEFFQNRMEYEYEIDAISGEILKFDSDYDD